MRVKNAYKNTFNPTRAVQPTHSLNKQTALDLIVSKENIKHGQGNPTGNNTSEQLSKKNKSKEEENTILFIYLKNLDLK